MAASDRLGLRNAVRAVVLVVGSVFTVATFALAIDLPVLRGLYSYQFSFVPGHWIAQQLNQVSGEERDTCLFLGTSVVREGFDSAIVADVSGTFQVANIATTASLAPIGVIEFQAQIARDRDAKFKCIVLGFNGYYLRDLSDVSYEMLSTDYFSQLPIWSVLRLSNVDQVVPQLPKVAGRSLYPLGRHSMILQRGVRRAAARLHQLLVGRLSSSSFEGSGGEFTPATQYHYEGRPSAYHEAIYARQQEIQSDNSSEPDLYTSQAAWAAYIRSVELLSEMTDNLFVLSMPLAHVYEPVEAAAQASFEQASVGLPVSFFIACKFDRAAEPFVFHDSGHLNADGRQQLSENVGLVLSGLLSGVPRGSSLCEVKRRL